MLIMCADHMNKYTNIFGSVFVLLGTEIDYGHFKPVGMRACLRGGSLCWEWGLPQCASSKQPAHDLLILEALQVDSHIPLDGKAHYFTGGADGYMHILSNYASSSLNHGILDNPRCWAW